MKPLFKRLHCKIPKVWKQVIMHEDKFDKIKSEFTDLFSIVEKILKGRITAHWLNLKS